MIGIEESKPEDVVQNEKKKGGDEGRGRGVEERKRAKQLDVGKMRNKSDRTWDERKAFVNKEEKVNDEQRNDGDAYEALGEGGVLLSKLDKVVEAACEAYCSKDEEEVG